MKKICFIIVLCFIFVAPSWATDTGSFNSETLVEFTEDDHSTHNYSSLPGTVEHPISHYAGPMINTIPSDQETPSLYNFKKMLGIQDVMSIQEALNITNEMDLSSGRVNNLAGYQISPQFVNPNTRIQIITFVSRSKIFVSMAEVNPVSHDRFETPLNRVAWTVIQSSQLGADVIYYNCQGLDKELKSRKFDVGGTGERLATASSRVIGSVLEMFLSGGKSSTKWMMPGWLNTFAGRLYTKKEMREFWEFIYNDFQESEMTVKEYASQSLINPYIASNATDFEELLNIALKQKWCFNELFKSQDLPKTLWTKKELDNKSWKKANLSNLRVSYTGMAIYFNHKGIVLRKDQRANTEKIKSWAKAHGLGMYKNGEIFIVAGLCDGTGPESVNWSQYGPPRAFLAADFIIAGLKEIVDKNGERLLSDETITKMVMKLSGGENNPLTSLVPENVKNQSERVALVFRGKRIKGERK